ncbi:MAG TPA: hypothetical protein VMT64_05255, partial [Candidatus Binataceae bacterium]|nr:hypothetical protein [Candidatus Binataceae bacterium]
MNLKRKNRLPILSLAAVAIVALLLTSDSRIAKAEGKGLDVEIAYEIKALKISGSTSPVYVQVDGDK